MKGKFKPILSSTIRFYVTLAFKSAFEQPEFVFSSMPVAFGDDGKLYGSVVYEDQVTADFDLNFYSSEQLKKDEEPDELDFSQQPTP